MYDLVEWAAAQPWSDGNVGMIGISYFAGTQMEAAVERPPHLKAIMPIAGTYDLYESATHHGLMSSSFLTPFLYMIGMTSGHTNKLWRSKLTDAMRGLLLSPAIHKSFEHANGEAAIAGLKVLLKLHNHVRVAMMGEHGLAWPWESLHIEALAWFDHWLKGEDTGILDGPRFRYRLPETEGWRTTAAWPLPEALNRGYALRGDGTLAEDEGESGARTYMNLGAGLNRPRASKTDPPSFLVWDTAPLAQDPDIVGPIELQLDAVSTAPDTAFIATFQDVSEVGHAVDVTAGYLRAGLRKVDAAASKPGSPVLACTTFEALPIGEVVRYRIPLVPNARRFKAGHKIRLYLTTDDQAEEKPALLMFRHASIGTNSLNTILPSSRLLLPVLPK